MANVIKIGVPNPDELLATNEYGAGALIRVERSTTGGTGYSEVGTVALLAAITSYTYSDPTGVDGSWYRTRYSNSGNTSQSSYGPEFQATSVRADYAMLAPVKLRLGIADTDVTSDAILQSICDQVNGWVESKTGRTLKPTPAFSTTTTGVLAVGATSIPLTTAANLAVGDALMLGPVTGTHEHVTVAAISGVTVTPQAPVVNGYGSGATAQRCYLFDGGEALEGGYMIPVPSGIVSMTSLEVAFYTGGAFNLIPPTDWFLRPLPLDREPGWPATEIWMTDVPSSGNPAPMFYTTRYGRGGYGTARALGTPGWPAMPREIVGLAEKLVVGTFRGRGSGGGGSVTIGSDGERTIEMSMSSQDWRTINRYASQEVLIV